MRFWTIPESGRFWPERRGDDGFKEALVVRYSLSDGGGAGLRGSQSTS